MSSSMLSASLPRLRSTARRLPSASLWSPSASCSAAVTSQAALGEKRRSRVRRVGGPPSKRDFLSFNPFGSEEASEEPTTHMERRLVNFSPKEVYDIVVNVDDYKDFVPWCTDSRVLQWKDKTTFSAELGVGFKMLSENYTSFITAHPHTFVKAEVPESTLFKHLINEWKFEKGTRQRTTWLSFLISFKFHSRSYQGLSSMFYNQVASRMVEAFERRAIQLYGR